MIESILISLAFFIFGAYCFTEQNKKHEKIKLHFSEMCARFNNDVYVKQRALLLARRDVLSNAIERDKTVLRCLSLISTSARNHRDIRLHTSVLSQIEDLKRGIHDGAYELRVLSEEIRLLDNARSAN